MTKVTEIKTKDQLELEKYRKGDEACRVFEQEFNAALDKASENGAPCGFIYTIIQGESHRLIRDVVDPSEGFGDDDSDGALH